MRAFVRLIRPADWIKNTFVFAALVFGNKLADMHALGVSIAAFFAFSFTASAGYIFNDILDRDRDRHHPKKMFRPIASGQISPQSAAVLMVGLLLLAALITVLFLPPAPARRFGGVLFGYLALSLAYSMVLKHRILLDVILIAVLFVFRAMGGAVAIDVRISEWMVVCTFMLCLFLGFGKRRCEIAAIGNAEGEVKQHRRVLDRYTPDLLNQLLSTSGGIAIITFLLYTLDSRPSPIPKDRLIYTLPLVVYGIYRYAMLIELGKATGPTELIIKDAPFLATVALWVASALILLYWHVPAGPH